VRGGGERRGRKEGEKGELIRKAGKNRKKKNDETHTDTYVHTCTHIALSAYIHTQGEGEMRENGKQRFSSSFFFSYRLSSSRNIQLAPSLSSAFFGHHLSRRYKPSTHSMRVSPRYAIALFFFVGHKQHQQPHMHAHKHKRKQEKSPASGKVKQRACGSAEGTQNSGEGRRKCVCVWGGGSGFL
jgi:hypothetical protein